MSPPSDFVHRFVAGNDSHAPVLLLLHGTGGTENDLISLGAGLRPGAPLLSPLGQVLENGMPRFFRRFAEGVFDEADLVRRTEDLASFVEGSKERYGLVDRRVVAVGYSNGANIAASLLLLRPGVLAGAVLLRAMAPIRPARKPDLKAIPVFLAGGRDDHIIRPETTRELAGMLESAGAEVTLTWSQGGHSLTLADVNGAREWMGARFG